jgi:hypothetical protein
MDSKERRGASRVQLHAAVCLKFEGQLLAGDADLRDISLDGFCIRFSRTVPINSVCELEITITGPSSVLHLTGKGRIIRNDSQGTAVKFTELDMDSFMHLKHIVLYNRAPENT